MCFSLQLTLQAFLCAQHEHYLWGESHKGARQRENLANLQGGCGDVTAQSSR